MEDGASSSRIGRGRAGLMRAARGGSNHRGGATRAVRPRIEYPDIVERFRKDPKCLGKINLEISQMTKDAVVIALQQFKLPTQYVIYLLYV